VHQQITTTAPKSRDNMRSMSMRKCPKISQLFVILRKKWVRMQKGPEYT
jgi:hypothetical protein